MNNLAFIFPGQGSQKIGMLADIATEYSLLRDTFDSASQVLGYDLWALCQEGEQDAINQTEVTQPLLLTASISLWRIWQHLSGPLPTMMAGHSLGEWSALVASGALRFEDAVRLVQHRGRYMQEAVPKGQGAMAAIVGLDDVDVESACSQVSGEEFVGPVNYNSPGQVVIAGHAQAVERAMQACKDAGAKRALPLPVSAPFHTPLMQPAADRLATEILATELQAPQIPVFHNVGATTADGTDEIRQRMIQQITAPVPWVACVQAMAKAGATKMVECGPGKVLAGLGKRIDASIEMVNIDSLASLHAALEGE
jgi:[acyl-carrier-protein] S-malonyltransferase